MARIAAFQPYRYSASAGKLDDLVTQPYDKITPAMRASYQSLSPYNLVRIILGEEQDRDTGADNAYTRARHYFQEWIQQGVLRQDQEPALYAYFQRFTMPESGERLTRKGFIGLGAVESYEANIVYRHEQTLSAPKKDRRQLLEHTRAHFGQIFMLYSDLEYRIDRLLDEAAAGEPAACVVDEYATIHSLYRIASPEKIATIRDAMADKKLLIADGHHRYETALGFRRDHPEIQDAEWVMMTFVNMYSAGLRILATHRLLYGLAAFDADLFLDRARERFSLTYVDSAASLVRLFEQPSRESVRIGVAVAGSDRIAVLERRRRPGELDVGILHEELIEGALGIHPDAIRDGKFLTYVRGIENATDILSDGCGQIAFLLQPTTMEQVAETSFAGSLLPQKSTDFYPKLLSGLTIYKLEK